MTEPDSTHDPSDDRHPAEQRTEATDREPDISILQGLETEMDEVQAALDRLEDGTYGPCGICGRPIGDERLEALPAARYCVDHERAREEAVLRPSLPPLWEKMPPEGAD